MFGWQACAASKSRLHFCFRHRLVRSGIVYGTPTLKFEARFSTCTQEEQDFHRRTVLGWVYIAIKFISRHLISSRKSAVRVNFVPAQHTFYLLLDHCRRPQSLSRTLIEGSTVSPLGTSKLMSAVAYEIKKQQGSKDETCALEGHAVQNDLFKKQATNGLP